jgi:hypothetical protein
MTNEPEHTAGSHPVGAGKEARGWGGDEVVRDHSGQPAGESGWESERVVRDQGENDDPGADSGWSGSEVVRDHGEAPAADAGGWSADEVVKDHGEGPAS